MSKVYKISELLMNNETPYYSECPELSNYRRVREVEDHGRTRYLTWVDDKNMESIRNPDGRELTPEELFNFVIGNGITDYAKGKGQLADVAIVLGSGSFPETRARAIKAFELYKKGRVKKIIFTGGVAKARDTRRIMYPETMEQFMSGAVPELEWQDLSEADWGAETFVPGVYEEGSGIAMSKLTPEFLESMGVNPEDVIIEPMSRSTQENATFCRNTFDMLRIETGESISSAVLVTTVTHGSRAMRQFQKLFGDDIQLSWCPATADLEQYGNMRNILNAHEFDEEAFRRELKRIYCTTPVLTKKLMEETANHRNAFILGDIYEPSITTEDEQREEER
ncbi:MAG: YdcF family protein [Clostridia bacterium]|nr:YdcF family protein [Clostridia bacterium]